MSYQRFLKPKIYTDNINWLLSNGYMSLTDIITNDSLSFASGSSLYELFDMRPSNIQTVTANGQNGALEIRINTQTETNSEQDGNFIAILGHNFEDAGAKMTLLSDDSAAFLSPHSSSRTVLDLTNVVNMADQADTASGATVNDDTLAPSGNGVSAADTTLTVNDGTKVRAGDFVKINDEILYIEAVSSNNLTVDRGVGGTSAAPHVNGNALNFTGNTTFPANGWSLATFTNTSDNQYFKIIIQPDGNGADTFSADLKIGAILIGETYTFPTSPDLSITKSFSFDGLEFNESVGGQVYANAPYLKAPNWFLEPFATGTGSTADNRGKTGRMNLSMNYSYLDDTDAYLENLHGGSSVATSNTLYSNLISKTQNGMHPMLFQYDSTVTTTLDAFLWCRLNNTPDFTQVSNKFWSVGIDLREEF